jgi:hypothetical protein
MSDEIISIVEAKVGEAQKLLTEMQEQKKKIARLKQCLLEAAAAIPNIGVSNENFVDGSNRSQEMTKNQNFQSDDHSGQGSQNIKINSNKKSDGYKDTDSQKMESNLVFQSDENLSSTVPAQKKHVKERKEKDVRKSKWAKLIGPVFLKQKRLTSGELSDLLTENMSEKDRHAFIKTMYSGLTYLKEKGFIKKDDRHWERTSKFL